MYLQYMDSCVLYKVKSLYKVTTEDEELIESNCLFTDAAIL